MFTVEKPESHGLKIIVSVFQQQKKQLNLNSNTMKSQIFIFSVLLMLTGCMAKTNDKVSDNIQKYSTVWDAILNEGQMELFNSDNFSEDVVMHAEPENIVGIAGMRDYYANFHTGFPGFEFGIKDIFGQEDKLVKHWYFKGIHTGEFFGMPATGKVVELEGTTLVEMRDGKIVSEHDFMDNLSMFTQLGMVSDPANLEVVNGLYENFAAGNIPAAVSAMDPNIEWNEAESFPYADGNPYIGPQAVLEGVFGRIGEEWEYWNLTDIKLHEMSNNQVLSTLRYKAKYKKNGAEIDAQVAHFWTLNDGKITRFQQFADTDKVVRAMQ